MALTGEFKAKVTPYLIEKISKDIFKKKKKKIDKDGNVTTKAKVNLTKQECDIVAVEIVSKML